LTPEQAPTIWHLIHLRSAKVYGKPLTQPRHFRHWIYKLHRAVGGSLREYFHAPIQHGKTLVTLWGLAWLCLHNPGKSFAYMTFSAERAGEINLLFRGILKACDLDFVGTRRELRLANGVTIKFVSATQGLTGVALSGALIVDDLYRGDQDASSEAYRKRIEHEWTNSVNGRVGDGASVLVLGTRWHPQDWYGKLIAEQEYSELRLCAIAEEGDPLGRAVGEALFPELRSLERLEWIRRTAPPTAWAALYQGRPRARGAGVFRQPGFYTSLPGNRRGAFGVDLAYTSKTTSDESVLVELWREETKDPDRPLFYVVDMWHARCAPEVTVEHFMVKAKAQPSWMLAWRCSSVERGAGTFMRRPPYNLHNLVMRSVPGDKLISNTPVAIAWNDGRVLLPDMAAYPQHAEWCKYMLDQALDFTGTGDEPDDVIDALGNAYNEIRGGASTGMQTAKSSR
jgi:hypothetical protein